MGSAFLQPHVGDSGGTEAELRRSESAARMSFRHWWFPLSDNQWLSRAADISRCPAFVGDLKVGRADTADGPETDR